MSGRGLLLAIAIIIAAVVIISIQGQMDQDPSGEMQKDVRIMVAREDLAVGAFVQGSQDLDWFLVDKISAQEFTSSEALIENEDGGGFNVNTDKFFSDSNVRLDDFNGAVVRRALKAGDPIPQDALMKSGEGGFLSAVLEPGLRAVSIAVNATTGNAGFVSPGDKVDLIVTHRYRHSNSNEESVISKTFVHDVRIVAVDQMLDNPENKAILAKTVTIECRPQQAEQIAVANEMGKISLALRSLSPEVVVETVNGQPVVLRNENGDIDEAAKRGYTRDIDLNDVLDRRVLEPPRVLVIRGDESQTIDFTMSAK